MVDVPTDQIVSAESGGVPTAQNPNSSAAGPGQFIDSTWLATVKQHAPEVAKDKSDAEILALKNDPTLAVLPQNVALAHQMTGAYASDNQSYLSKNGVPVTPGTVYLAHFAGPQGAVKILQADPNTPVSQILDPSAVKANKFLDGMTAQGLQAWAAKKMGTQAPTPGPRPGPPGNPEGTPPIAPALADAQSPAALLQSAAPIFAAANASSSTPGQAPQPMKLSPIFAAQSRPIDLSRLRAQIAQFNPIFASRG